jgi:hypothetical protein
VWQPKVLNPEPEPWFVKEVKKIDPNLRVVWGYGRYLVNQWALERKIPPERYHQMYKSLIESGEPRFIKQPIFDSNQPIIDEYTGEIETYVQVGERDWDLAPEYEWVSYSEHLNEEFLTRIRRSYAWERNHPISRMKFEQKQEEEAKQANWAKQRKEAIREGVEEAYHKMRKKIVFGYGESRNEQTAEEALKDI